MMLSYFIHALISVFAVLNPLGILPTFLAITDGKHPIERRRIARKAIVYSFFIVLMFLLLGHLILTLFGITIEAFRVAGGILVFFIAFQLLNAQPSHIQTPHEDESQPKPDITLTPLALPIIAGPGTIATVMALAAGPNILMHSAAVFIACVIVLAGTYCIFHYASSINRYIGHTGLNVITRLMGFILTIIAVQMAATGLVGLFPGWAH
ncbi:MarC family protein [Alicyclobacillus fastidiosus]|uniref:UPF0056 membrane protein n=1 Tax=Alicyclobacillus fastidiosus TaxID=392011 RepID=A0ABY6ZNX0_9BACL|nr:MarC family protein [Alicyclobacillus fastidiosus]WAH44678.1 MarC family protein [Alicyclobacillus fastidiosus]